MNSKKKVLILGAAGMAGHMIYHYLNDSGQFDLYTTVHSTKLNEESFYCDVRNASELERIIKLVKPDYLINTVGALIKESNNNPANSILLNSWLPHQLSKFSLIFKFKLIHISTDCVFSGKKGNYQVDDFKDADDVYGRSKSLGELINNKDVTLRTSIIGPELKKNGEGLIHWFFTQKQTVEGYDNVFWSGITTLELAKVIYHTILFFRPGVYNISPHEKISKYHLLLLLKKTFNLKIEIIKGSSIPKDKSLINSFNNNYSVNSFEKMAEELYFFIKDKRLLYTNYKLIFN